MCCCLATAGDESNRISACSCVCVCLCVFMFERLRDVYDIRMLTWMCVCICEYVCVCAHIYHYLLLQTI